jgi:hypothetical protein
MGLGVLFDFAGVPRLGRLTHSERRERVSKPQGVPVDTTEVLHNLRTEQELSTDHVLPEAQQFHGVHVARGSEQFANHRVRFFEYAKALIEKQNVDLLAVQERLSNDDTNSDTSSHERSERLKEVDPISWMAHCRMVEGDPGEECSRGGVTGMRLSLTPGDCCGYGPAG